MLKFYYHPLSVNARRVWVALLEKQVSFEPIPLKLNGDQFQPDFTALNPFQSVPVLLDGEFRVLESLAILDYLEAKYPSPPLVPTPPEAIATVRMVELVAVNELQAATIPLMKKMVQLEVTEAQLEVSKTKITTVLAFLASLLGDRTFFAGDFFSFAEVVAGTMVPSLDMFQISLTDYPNLDQWANRLSDRPSWKATNPSPAAIAKALPNIRKVLSKR